MGCGTSKDIQPPVSNAQTTLLQETRLQQAQEGTQQAFSTCKDDDDKLDQPASKAGAESNQSLAISADSSCCCRQITQPIDSQTRNRAEYHAGQGSDMPVQVAACEPAAALSPGIEPSTCKVESVGQSKTLSDSGKGTGQDLFSMDRGAPAARLEEEVQPFQESVDPQLPMVGDMSEGSPWAYLQKTYSNLDEAVPCTSETKGPDHFQAESPSLVEVHSGAAMPMQAGNTPTPSQTSGANVWFRNVPENAWADAASCPAASHDAAHQHPVKESSGITSAPAQTVVDDLGMQDVDEFEAELAALNDAKSA